MLQSNESRAAIVWTTRRIESPEAFNAVMISNAPPQTNSFTGRGGGTRLSHIPSRMRGSCPMPSSLPSGNRPHTSSGGIQSHHSDHRGADHQSGAILNDRPGSSSLGLPRQPPNQGGLTSWKDVRQPREERAADIHAVRGAEKTEQPNSHYMLADPVTAPSRIVTSSPTERSAVCMYSRPYRKSFEPPDQGVRRVVRSHRSRPPQRQDFQL